GRRAPGRRVEAMPSGPDRGQRESGRQSTSWITCPTLTSRRPGAHRQSSGEELPPSITPVACDHSQHACVIPNSVLHQCHGYPCCPSLPQQGGGASAVGSPAPAWLTSSSPRPSETGPKVECHARASAVGGCLSTPILLK